MKGGQGAWVGATVLGGELEGGYGTRVSGKAGCMLGHIPHERGDMPWWRLWRHVEGMRAQTTNCISTYNCASVRARTQHPFSIKWFSVSQATLWLAGRCLMS